MTTDKGGPPSIEQKFTDKEYEKIEMMGKFRATYETMAADLEISISAVEKKMSGDTRFKRCYTKGLSKLRLSLASAQIKAAVEDKNATMLIWLGKQHLDQKDTINTVSNIGSGNKILNLNMKTDDVLKEIAELEKKLNKK